MRGKVKRYQAHYYFKRRRASRLQLPELPLHQAARHPFAVPVMTLIGLFLVTTGMYLLLHRQPDTISPNIVVISHDGQKQTVSSKEPTVGALLTKLSLKVNEGDVVEPALDTPIQQDDFRINIYRAVPIEIVDVGHKTFALSAGATERAVAAQAGVTVYPEDRLTEQPVTDFVASGSVTEEVVIDRATPVNVNLYGAPVVMRTHATTVGGLLAERNIHLKPQDTVKPDPSTPITAAAQIAVIRNGLSTLTVQQDVPMPTQTVMDDSLAYGTSAVRQQGAPGKQAVTYQINTQNGVEVGRTVIQTTMIQPPVAQVVVMGTNLSGIKGDMALAGIASSEYQYADYIISHESGWCPTKAQGQYGGCPAYAGYVPPYGGYGLCQSTPGSKMATAGADWATNPVTQLKWCTGYARSRYGSWYSAYEHWLSYHNW